jgi:ankyrin repeat protein
MSRDDDSSHVNLEQQRKRAKDLRRAHRAGSAEAAARIARHLPRAAGQPAAALLAAPFALSEAQLVVAREAGFPSWPAMKHALAPAGAPDAAAVAETLLEAALAGDEAAVGALLAQDPAAPAAARRSLPLAAALGDADAALALIDADPASADRPAEGRRRWTPLLLLCYSRYRRDHQPARAARLQIAERLLVAGADPNALGVEPGYTSGNVSMLDEHDWRPLEGAAGRAVSVELIDLLLAAGADPKKTSTFLIQSVRGGDPAVLARALAARPRWFQINWALKAAVVFDRPDLARQLMRRLELPPHAGPALAEAIWLERDAVFVELLLGDDARPALHLPVRRATYRLAIRHGQQAAAEVLRRRGADDATVTTVDRVIGAAVSEDRAALERLLAGGASARSFEPQDHRMLSWVVRRRRFGAVPLLLAAGLDPDAADVDGDRPLHLAVRAVALPTVEVLLAAGAAVDARDFDGETPLDRALALPDGAARDRLVQRLLDAGASATVKPEDPDLLFERAADAVVAGDLETLGTLLDDEPALVHARSPRPHRATLLHYLGANGSEDPRQRTPPNAPAVARLLLERGADPNAECRFYGGGATTMGLMLTSVFPRDAGVDGELARELARGGARVGPGALVTAILHALPRAAAALAEAGVPADDLLAAAGLGRREQVLALLARGVDVNQRFHDQYTALMAAAGMGNDEMVKLLLDHGADPALCDTAWNGTAADKARVFGHPATAALIASYRGRA